MKQEKVTPKKVIKKVPSKPDDQDRVKVLVVWWEESVYLLALTVTKKEAEMLKTFHGSYINGCVGQAGEEFGEREIFDKMYEYFYPGDDGVFRFANEREKYLNEPLLASEFQPDFTIVTGFMP